MKHNGVKDMTQLGLPKQCDEERDGAWGERHDTTGVAKTMRGRAD